MSREEKKEVKKSFIIKIQEKIVNFIIQYKASRTRMKYELNMSEQQELKTKLEKAYIEKDIKEKKLAIRLDTSNRIKGFIYLFFSVTTNIVSIALSVLGITNVNTFKDLYSNINILSYGLFITLLQFSVWLVSFNSNYIKLKFYNHYKALNLLQKMLIGISMLGNYLFLSRLIVGKTFLDYLFAIVVAISLDIVSNKFSGLSQDCFYLNYSKYSFKNEIDDYNDNYFYMFWFIITYKLRVWIKEQYSKRIIDYKTRMKNIGCLKSDDDSVCDNSNNNMDIVNINYDYENIKRSILKMNKGQIVSAKKFNISSKSWRELQKQLVEDRLIIINGSKSLVA